MGKILLEALLFAVVYSIVIVVLFHIQGAKMQIYNYPPKIQERCKELGIVDEKKMKKCAIINKTVGVLLIVVMLIGIILFYNGERKFLPIFLQSYLFLNAFSWFDALVIDCLYFCHGKFWIIPGTEDMQDEYHNYWFHIRFAVIGLVSLAAIAAVLALIMVGIGKLM